jgi:hypothetical protein
MRTDPQPRERTGREEREALRRTRNRADHFAAKADRAGSPLERAAALWDQWRALARELDDDERDRRAEEMARALEDHIDDMTRERDA